MQDILLSITLTWISQGYLAECQSVLEDPRKLHSYVWCLGKVAYKSGLYWVPVLATFSFRVWLEFLQNDEGLQEALKWKLPKLGFYLNRIIFLLLVKGDIGLPRLKGRGSTCPTS